MCAFAPKIVLGIFFIASAIRQNDAQAPEEELIYSLPGFSVQSGIKVGQAYVPPEVNQTDLEPLSILFQSSIPGNNSEFTICLRLKAHYHRPETVLMSAYVENKTAILIGMDDAKGQIYFKYSVSALSNELTRLVFDWAPRVNVWEHVCFMKKPEEEKENSQLKFFANGENVGKASDVTASIDDLTLVMLGQTDPSSAVTAFAGELAHFAIFDRSVPLKEIKVLASCGQEYLGLLRQAAPTFLWQEGVWEPVVKPSNETQIDALSIPVGLYVDWREVCTAFNQTLDKLYTVPIYRKKSKEFHDQTCKNIGGTVPDLANFGAPGSDKRVKFVTDMMVSSRIPNIIPLIKNMNEEGEEIPLQVPINMQNCYVNDELVVWLEDSGKPVQPPMARGAKGINQFPIDPRTGKPLNFLPAGLNVAFGPGIGGSGGDGGGGGKEEPTDCPYHILSNGTAVRKCDNDPQACGICLVSRKKPAINIRGLCEKSLLSDHRDEEQSDGGYGQAEFDSEFYAFPDRISGETIFRGKFGSRIRKNVTDFEVEHRPGDWILESLITPYRDDSSTILKKIPAIKLPAGRNIWQMVSQVCQEGPDDSENRIISVTSCKKNQFTCDSGQCIPLNYRCDLYKDCDEGEDEVGCSLLDIDDDYKGQQSPRHGQKGVPWPVYIEVEVVAFPQILALEQRISIDFHLSLRWYDPRLTYHNLKKGKQENPVSVDNIVSLWVPRLGLLNGLSEFQTIVIEDDAPLYRGYIWRRGPSEPNGVDNPVEDEVFEGSKNPLILKREFYQDFKCDFDLLWYPFDRQRCFMNFTVIGQSARSLILRPDNKDVKYYGKEYLVEYRVESLTLSVPNVKGGNYSTATVEMVFHRRVVYHLLNIFMQSLLLILTGYMSLFFHANNFSDRVMVALTVMLVMASLQSSIQDSLPRTAYFKFIDWWILFSLNAQIFIMAFHTFLGYKCYWEYRKYKDNFYKRAKINENPEGDDESSAGTNSNGGSAHGVSNRAYVLEKYFGKRKKSQSSILQNADTQSEPVSAEEFHYPRAERLNTIATFLFFLALIVFNIIYWTIALIVYLG